MPQTSKAIPIFRAGRHTAMGGQELNFSEADLKAAAEAYDPNLHEAPLVVGHPQSNAPAYGWVRGLDYDESTLAARPHQVNQDFAELVNSGAFKKVSASFYPPDSQANPVPGVYYLRHVGFLGAQPPSVKGLGSAEFGDDAGEAVTIEFAEMPTGLPAVLRNLREWLISQFGMDTANQVAPGFIVEQAEDELRRPEPEPEADFSEPDNGGADVPDPQKQEQLTQKERELQERENRLAQQEAETRKAEARDFAEQLVNQGKLLPREKEPLVEFMCGLDGEQQISFAEGEEGQTKTASGRDWLKGLLSSLPQRVDFGERAPAGEDEPASATVDVPAGYSVDNERAELHRKALDYQEKHNTDYVTAVNAVSD